MAQQQRSRLSTLLRRLRKIRFMTLGLLLGTLPLAACQSSAPTPVCTPGYAECVGERQIRSCGADGQWEAPRDCPEGQACMTMSGGMTHCM